MGLGGVGREEEAFKEGVATSFFWWLKRRGRDGTSPPVACALVGVWRFGVCGRSGAARAFFGRCFRCLESLKG